ncbi:phosphopyruvate hydratase [Brucellaceae bacterium C25G]
MPDKIISVTAQQIIDSKCRPVVEVEIITESGATGRGAAPTGTSVGMHEAFVLRDGDPAQYKGLSVHSAIKNVVQIIGPSIIGMDVSNQRAIDEKMIALDGTKDKHKLGGNAIYSTSIAAFRAAAHSKGMPLYNYIAGGPIQTIPVPCFNIVNGGHFDGITQPFNEFLIVPYGAENIEAAVAMAVSVYDVLGDVLQDYLGYKPPIAGSYGYAAPSGDPEVILSLMNKAIDKTGNTGRIALALDCASSEMFEPDTQTYLLKGRRVKSDELIEYARYLTERFNLVFIEDLLDENDWHGFIEAHKCVTRTLIIGDDLTVTNPALLQRAFEQGAVDGFVLKPNQIGTITEAMDAYRYAEKHALLAVPSGRSGGVMDDVVMDFSVGLQVPFQKNGAPRSGERIEKLNFLMRVAARNPGTRLYDISHLLKFTQ